MHVEEIKSLVTNAKPLKSVASRGQHVIRKRNRVSALQNCPSQIILINVERVSFETELICCLDKWNNSISSCHHNWKLIAIFAIYLFVVVCSPSCFDDDTKRNRGVGKWELFLSRAMWGVEFSDGMPWQPVYLSIWNDFNCKQRRHYWMQR